MINEQIFRLKKDGTPTTKCVCRHPELIENYDKAVADTTQSWICHHRLETHNSDGKQRLVNILGEELIALGMYYDRPSEELIFLTPAQHAKLHRKNKKRSEETRAKISVTMKGSQRSEETRAKISASHKGKPSPNKGKSLSEEIKAKISAANKGKKHSEEWKAKISATMKGKKRGHYRK